MCGWSACVLLFGLILNACGEVTITELSGTEEAELGTSLTLDCAYSVQNETGVEVKWFYKEKQIVSWIPSRNQPQAIGTFSKLLNITDSTLKDGAGHTTIQFNEVTFDLTGDYTCKVSADVGEDSKTQTMVVYQPPSAVDFWNNENEAPEDAIQVLICSASELYPMPNVTVVGTYISGSNESVPIVVDQEIIVNDIDGNSYNITKIYKFDPSTLEGSVEFTCNVYIPDTIYHEEKALTYTKESNETTVEYPDVYDYDNATIPTESSINSTTIYSTTIYSTTEGRDSAMSCFPLKWLMVGAMAALVTNR